MAKLIVNDSKSNRFQNFLDEVTRYAGGVHKLNKGLPIKQIKKAEQILGLNFPEEYKEFLRVANGGHLFREIIILLEINDGSQKPPSSICDFIDLNKNKVPVIPASYLVVASYNYGDVICLDPKGKAHLWDHEIGKFIETWNSFVDWLEYVMTLYKESYNYDGSLKPTFFEKIISKVKDLFNW